MLMQGVSGKPARFVVYFDLRLGAAHSKRWSKYAFSVFFVLKTFKKCNKVRNLQQNLRKKLNFLGRKRLTSILVQTQKNWQNLAIKIKHQLLENCPWYFHASIGDYWILTVF